jgi:hypothetical protein
MVMLTLTQFQFPNRKQPMNEWMDHKYLAHALRPSMICCALSNGGIIK